MLALTVAGLLYTDSISNRDELLVAAVAVIAALGVFCHYAIRLYLKKWIREEMIAEAAQTAAVVKKLNKFNIHTEPELQYVGNNRWEFVDNDFYEKDVRDMERFCKYYQKIRFDETIHTAMEFSYKLGYYRRELMVQEERKRKKPPVEFEPIPRKGKVYEPEPLPDEEWTEPETAAMAAGVEVETDSEESASDLEEVVLDLMNRGYSGKQIAAELEISESKVSRIRKKHNV